MILCGDDFLWLVRLLNSNWDWVWVQIRNLKIWPYHLPQQNGQPMIPGLLLLIISAISLGISNRVRTVRTCILDKELHNFAGLDPHFCWLNHMKSPFLPVKSSFVHSFPLVKVPIFQIVVEPFHSKKSLPLSDDKTWFDQQEIHSIKKHMTMWIEPLKIVIYTPKKW